jgi:6-pyruvoyl-tetrahydropterin synthase
MAHAIRKGIYVDFAHTVAGHPGACINIHGHTWMFEVELSCGKGDLDDNNFVTDFGNLKRQVLEPVHLLLDHSYACGEEIYRDGLKGFEILGGVLLATRKKEHKERGYKCWGDGATGLTLNGARNETPGGLKLAVFPFNPTSELLAQWLKELAEQKMRTSKIAVLRANVYETLHPVEAVASFGNV